jgi:hypothetical protein
MVVRAPSSPRALADALRAFGRRSRGVLWIGGLVFALGLAGTAARVLSAKRLYRSEATLLYEHGVLQAEPDSPRQIGERLQEMLTSRPRLQGLIEEMRLYPTVVAERGLPAAVDEMRAQVEVTVGEGTTFGASYDTDDGDRARAVLMRLVNGVVDDDTQRRQHAADDVRQNLEAERRQADQEVKMKENRLAAFSAEHPRLAPASSARGPDRDRSTASAAEVASLGMRAAELEQKLAQASGHPNPARAAVPGAPHTPDPAVVDARAQAASELSAAERDLDDKQTHLPYQHPDVKIAQRRVEDERAALRKADAAVAASAAAHAVPGAVKPGSDEQVASLQRALAAVRSRIGALEAQSDLGRSGPPRTEAAAADTTGTRLARDVSEARERRRQLEAKLFQAQLLSTLGAAGQGGGLVVSERSYPPSRPIARGRYKVALAGTAISALLALLALTLAGRFDGRLHDAGDVARALGAEVVVVIPKLGVKLAGRPPVRATDRGA